MTVLVQTKTEYEVTFTIKKDKDSSWYWGYVNENGYYIIADLYFSLDMNQEGKDYLLKYVDNSPSPFFASLALLRAGIACEKIGENEEAFKIYKQLEEDYIDTKIADEIYYNLGRIYNKKGDLNKAREYYNKVILMYPMSIHAEMAKKRLLVLGYSNNPKIKKSEM